jgi:hypothetical protein
MTAKLGAKDNPIVIVADPFDWHYSGRLADGQFAEGYAHSCHDDVDAFASQVLAPLGIVEVTYCGVVGVHPAYKAAA